MSKETIIDLELEKRRYFGGKLSDFNSRAEANLEKKHLKAYLKGKETFQSGFRQMIAGRQPMRYNVIEIWK